MAPPWRAQTEIDRPGGSEDGPSHEGPGAPSRSVFERLTLALLLAASACILYVAVWLVMAFVFRGALEAAVSGAPDGMPAVTYSHLDLGRISVAPSRAHSRTDTGLGAVRGHRNLEGARGRGRDPGLELEAHFRLARRSAPNTLDIRRWDAHLRQRGRLRPRRNSNRGRSRGRGNTRSRATRARRHRARRYRTHPRRLGGRRDLRGGAARVRTSPHTRQPHTRSGRASPICAFRPRSGCRSAVRSS